MSLVAAVVGPTAAGKSEVGLALAARWGGAVLAADSMQVYRGLDIGTAKPTREDRERVPHCLIDLVDPEEDFAVAEFQREGRRLLADLGRRRIPAVIVGGSGLYFRALVDPLEFPPTDPDIRNRLEGLDPDDAVARLLAVDPGAGGLVDVRNPRRVVRALEVLELTGLTPTGRADGTGSERVRRYRSEIPVRAVGLDPGEALRERVVARCDRMIEHGLLEEVARIRERLGRTARQAVGYREMIGVVTGRWTLAEARAEMVRSTMALAKKQRTFFRRDTRIRWLPWHDDPSARIEAAWSAFEEWNWTS